MLINIYLGTIGWKWTGDELQASISYDVEYFFLEKVNIYILRNHRLEMDW